MEIGGGSFITNFTQTLRNLVRNPGFSVTVVLTLALGIAANSLIYSVIHAVLLRPLHYKAPEQLFALYRVTHESGEQEQVPYWSFPKFRVVEEQSRAFYTAAFFQRALPLTGRPDTERVQVEFVTPNYFALLGVDAQQGRTFLASDSNSPIVLIGHDLWQRRFGSDSGILGKTLHIDRRTLTVAGVMRKEFRGQSGTAQLWIPMNLVPLFTFRRRLETPYAHWHEVIGRIRTGVSPDRLESDLRLLAKSLAAAYPHVSGTNADQLRALPLKQANVDPRLKDSLVLLTSAVTLVLLIACANVANLILVRSIARTREIGIRTALGANRSKIIRLFLTESVLLALFAALIATVFSAWGADALRIWLPESQSQTGWHPFRLFSDVNPLHQQVLGFTLLVSCIVALLTGLPVAFLAVRLDPNDALKNETPVRLPVHRLANILVSAEVSLSLMLLICGGLILKSFLHLLSTNVGIKPDHVMTLKIDFPRDYNPTRFYERALHRISAMRTVSSASAASAMPLSSSSGATTMQILSRPDFNPESQPEVGFHIISENYFETLQIPLLQGRIFNGRDGAEDLRVAIINRTAAKQFWPNGDPIGERIRLGLGWEKPNDFAEIVGVVSDVKYGRADEIPSPDVYLFYRQPTEELMPFLLVRTQQDSPALAADLRNVVRSIDSDLPVYDVKTMNDRISDAHATTRFVSIILGAFAFIALCLACTGIYAVTSYTVTRRKKEIAVRIALGCRGWQVVKVTIINMAIYILAGTVCGVSFAMITMRIFRGVLHQVMPEDPVVYLNSAAILIAVAGLATILPVRRATRIDSMTLLKSE